MSESSKLEALIGVKTINEDIVTPSQLQRLSVTLNRRDPMPREGDAVPWGWHSIFFPRLIPSHSLSPDGMAPDFEGAPDSPLPRRMYAGNDLKFYEPMRVGDRLTKEIFIKSVVPKEGRTGKLIFVVYGIRILGPRGLVLEDDQNIVFRDEEPAGGKSASPAEAPARSDAPWKDSITLDSVMLYRFSACSFNPHRIHYDLP